MDSRILQQQSSSSLSAQSILCFIFPLFFGPQKLKTLALLDSGASACFLDEDFTKRHKILLVQKSKPVHEEVIDGRPLLSGSVTYESDPIEVTFKGHNNYSVLNIIRTPSNPVIHGLFWLEKYNASKYWRLQRITFLVEHPKSNHVRRPESRNPCLLEQERL